MADEHAGKNVLFKRGDGASNETFTTVAKILDMAGLNRTADTAEKTTRDSTGAYKEFLKTFIDAGEATFNMRWERDEFINLIADLESMDPVNYQFVMPDTGAMIEQFSGLVTNVGKTAPKDDIVDVAVTIKATGQPTQTS